MTAQFWIASEKFYETILPLMGIVFFLILQVIIFIRIYVKGTLKKRTTVGMVILMGALVVYGAWGYRKYNTYIEKSKLVTPLIRDRERKIFGYKYYPQTRKTIYSKLNDTTNLNKLSFYKKNEVSELIYFLGKKNYFYYFENSKGDLFKWTKGVEFSTAAFKTEMIGLQFSLTSTDFEEIGFIKKPNIMYDKIIVPKKDEHKLFVSENKDTILQAVEYYIHWNF